MPSKFSIEMQKNDSLSCDPALLKFSAFTGRTTRSEESIEAMVQSLLPPNGRQKHEIGIRKDKVNGDVFVIYGHTRVLALRRINERGLTKHKLLVRCKYWNVDEKEAALMTIQENEDDTRTPVSPIDQAENIRAMSELFGFSDTQIAESIGKKPAQISQLRKLLDLDFKTKDEVRAGRINMSQALVLADIEAPARKQVIEAAQATGASVTANGIANAARKMGVKTARPLRRNLNDLLAVIKQQVEQTEVGPTLTYLYSVLDFISGTETAEAMMTKLSAIQGLEDEEEPITATAGV